MPAITTYFAELGFGVNAKSVRKVDSALKSMEKKIKAFGKSMSSSMAINLVKFNVNQKALNFAMGNALDIASRQTVFQVSRFNVDQAHLNRTLSAAMLQASKSVARMNIRPNVTPQGARKVVEASGRTNGKHVVAGGVAGGIAGGLSRLYGPALALGLGGYGLGALNNRNQQVVAAQLQTSAIAQQAGATSEQGKASFEWLKKQADSIGFNYLDAAPDYNKLTSGLTGAGMSIQQSQGVFKGFSELSRVNKLDRTAQSRVYRALSQIAGKNKLQSEELTQQLAESLPGAVSLFAEAYQKQTGGAKTGQEAITELLAAMKKGKVKGDILTFAGDLASQKAQPGLSAASAASQAEQARYQNTVNNLATVASNSGVESGFARLFRALNDGLRESGPMVESLAKGFDNVSKYVSYALLSVQSLQRFFDGRDSYLGDKFFPDEQSRNIAFAFLNSYKSLMSEIVDLGKASINGWKELGSLMGTGPLAKFKEQIDTIANGLNAANKLTQGDYSGAVDSLKGFGKRYVNNITAPGRAGVNLVSDAVTYGLAAVDPRITTDQVNPWQINTPFSNTNSLFDYQRQAQDRQDVVLANRKRENFATPLGLFPIEKATMPEQSASQQPSPLAPKADVTLKMDVKITAANPEDFKSQFESSLADIVHQTLDKYSEKE